MLKSLFNKVAGLMVCNFFKKINSGAGVFLKVFRNFWEDLFCRTCPNGCLSKMNNEKIVFTKSIHRKTPVMASLLVQLQKCGLTVFPKGDSITDAFLWKLGSFTEHQFYRTMLRDCFWFPVAVSMCHLPHQW